MIIHWNVSCTCALEHFCWFLYYLVQLDHYKKMKFFIKDFFSKCNQIHSFLRIWPHLLKKSLMENFLFCSAVCFQVRSLMHRIHQFWTTLKSQTLWSASSKWHDFHCPKKWSFPLRIYSVNKNKSAVSCGSGHIYWRNP